MSEFCVKTFLYELESGSLRAAFPGEDGIWLANSGVKEKILTLFRSGKVQVVDTYYIDKAPLLPRKFTVNDQVRLVPFGSSVRSGACVSKGVVIMPPSYINVGAYIGAHSMVDSHVLVGSCAQIGEHVHLSAGVSIGGVLEPVEALPVIIEDHAFIGAGCVITSGFHIKRRAVLGSGVCLSRAIPVYDTVKHQVYYGYVPEGAVVVPGTRSISSFFPDTQLALQCGIILKYRDERTDAQIALEDALR
ncbi:2,3,4,5-tetrahydropyridine-2,6-dicarboxylate N-succinyltransferase [Holospora curviuscula]|uniref:2,3,4,5-tetrahydropyridine-2,6-dicarboxylate N-succinyltransferase n=1 Tax=Holospora curviuscula TaxID=1082868 RepID=A0A2S5R730_9PROT|nr:2,3,4,5-tetrahydropyridine-2,6-dicarboxylate N-succinyltransferase [Holospora curviuscula]PPE03114.1 2,3,4,5-tetrahydropyridine-2,6-dicarboxylate N-succinyltransferase [Holospora curviuscula]